MQFNQFRDAVSNQFDNMANHTLYTTVVGKDTMWDKYLGSFPEGTNPIYRTRGEFDCQCCKQFIRACGNVVGITDDFELVSIWDVELGESTFQIVADAMSALVKSKVIGDLFFHYQRTLGTYENHEMKEGIDVKTWEHFHYKLPQKFVKAELGTILSKKRTDKELFEKGVIEIDPDSAETILELIEQNSVYRGEEHQEAITKFIPFIQKYHTVDQAKRDNYCWYTSAKIGALGRIKNTAIGTLLIDVSEGMSLDKAVNLFGSKMAGYKRPKNPIVTQRMTDSAKKTVKEMGIEDSLPRRYAVQKDITINNVLFANKSAKKAMDVFDEIASSSPMDMKKFKKIENIPIEVFINDILPKAETVELLMENKHCNNLMSLIAPVYPEAPGIFKWNNNFSWAYRGENADSMKERVKKAGGKIDGDFRFSIQWNDKDTKGGSDLDAWCIQPNRSKVYYSRMRDNSTGCNLDVDITRPGTKVAVENIVIPRIDASHNGKYKLQVHNYSTNSGNKGFTAEFEYKGQIYSYEYGNSLRYNEVVTVAELLIEGGEVKFIKTLPSTKSIKEVWHINTNIFQNVSMIMNSPNHWDGNKTGNRHYFFIMENCRNDEKGRGFFNEFLKEDLREHRKVFEILGSTLKTEKSDEQLSGIGFSSTQKNNIFCKVTGAFTRTIKLIF